MCENVNFTSKASCIFELFILNWLFMKYHSIMIKDNKINKFKWPWYCNFLKQLLLYFYSFLSLRYQMTKDNSKLHIFLKKER